MESMGPLLTTGRAPLCTSDIWKKKTSKRHRPKEGLHTKPPSHFSIVSIVCIKILNPKHVCFRSHGFPYTNQPCSMWCCPDVEQLRTRDGREYRSVTTFPRSGVGEGCGAMRGGHTTGLRGGWINRAQTEIGKAIQKKTQQKVIWHPNKNWMGQLLFLFVTFSKIHLRLFSIFQLPGHCAGTP